MACPEDLEKVTGIIGRLAVVVPGTPKEEEEQNDNGQLPNLLCKTCRELGISRSTFIGPFDTKHGEHSLGDLSHIRNRSKSCPICLMVTKAASEYRIGRPQSDYFIQFVQKQNNLEGAFRLSWVPEAKVTANHTGIMNFRIRAGEWDVQNHLVGHDFGRISILAEGSVDSEHDISSASFLWYLGRPIGSHIDLSLCKKWVQCCKNWHGDACEKEMFSKLSDPWTSSHFRVIDVVVRCIVRPPEGSRYLALSYTWGRVETLLAKEENKDKLGKPGSLSELHDKIACTITDAMQVTLELGERYLWVDQLCIVQDNDISKSENLSLMDGIYARAFLTVIAAAGEDANAGLNGIKGRPRLMNQLIRELEDGLKVVLLPNLVEILVESTY